MKYKYFKGFPKPRINPGTMIKGGTAMNIIPDECEAHIDIRLSYGQTRKGVLGEIKKAIKKENAMADARVVIDPSTILRQKKSAKKTVFHHQHPSPHTTISHH